MMDPMRKEVNVSGNSIVWNIFIRMKNKSVQAIFHKSEKEQPDCWSKYGLAQVEATPVFNP